MDILTWLIVGLVAGVLASLIMGGTGYGIVGDIIIGIAGAFVGELGARAHWERACPSAGCPERFSSHSSARSCCCSCSASFAGRRGARRKTRWNAMVLDGVPRASANDLNP